MADPAVRHRGTFGGALSHADPAGDLPAVAAALDATFVIEGPNGRRAVPAAQFFFDYLETAVQPGRGAGRGQGAGARPRLGQRATRSSTGSPRPGRSSAWPRWSATEGGQITEARVGLTNMGPIPVRARGTERALAGASTRNGGITRATELAADGTEPPSDLSGQSDYRQHLARVLTRRAVQQAVAAS